MPDESGALSPQRVSTILDSIADGVFTIDIDWNITSFNRAGERITGFSREEAIGKKCFDIFRANICQSNCACRKSMESGQELVNLKVNILNRHGEMIPISISTAVLRDEQGEIVGGVETFRDISAIELLRKEIDDRYTFHDIISKSHLIRRIIDTLPDIAASDATVLIEGPTGSGKELFAKAIHNLSKREKHNCIAVNCGALPDALLESELFGYKKGAFTDAKNDKPGRFALAEKGTIFLDEIGDTSAAVQVKLLRVVQEKEYEPLGATKTVKADVRVVAATNRSLDEMVAEGAFREDLFYRLNVVKIVLPALKERREDIPLLVDHFIRQFNAEQGKQIEGISEEAIAVLLECELPGNVRQLRNIIEHTVVLCRGERIEAECLPSDILRSVENRCGSMSKLEGGESAAESTGSNPLAKAEVAAIVDALRRNEGHRAKTAAELGVDKTTLWRKMKKLNITYP